MEITIALIVIILLAPLWPFGRRFSLQRRTETESPMSLVTRKLFWL